MAIPIAAAGGADDDSEGRFHGRIHEAQTLLLRMGGRRLGPPVPEIEHHIRSVQDLKELEKLITQVLEAARWQDLFPSERGRSCL